jgi:hypothetical protein
VRAQYARENAALKTDLPTGTVGAIAELAVAVDLMDRGYEVFRALSPSCSCDLAVLMNGTLIRIEVRSGYLRNASTKLLFSKPARDDGRFDIYAVVLHSDPRNIIYLDPDSEEIEITSWQAASSDAS